MAVLTKEERQRAQELVLKIVNEWDYEKDEMLTANGVRAKMLISETPEYTVGVRSIKAYLKEYGIKYADSTEIAAGKSKKEKQELREANNLLSKECEKLIAKLNEKLITGEKDVDDLSRDMVARLYIMSKELMHKAMEDGSMTALKEALKVYKDACNSTLSTRIINNKPSEIVQEIEGVERLLKSYKKEDNIKKEGKLQPSPIKVMSG
jgi:hypothetical protein